MMRIAAVAWIALILSCGGKQTPAGSHSGGDDPDAGAPAVTSAAPDAGAGATPSSTSGGVLSDAECDRFVDHVVEIAARTLAERARKPGPDGKPDPDAANTEDEIVAVKAKLRSDLRAQCLAVPRTLYECAMQASDEAALGACQTAGGEAPPPR